MNEFQVQLYKAWCKKWAESSKYETRQFALHHIKRMSMMYEGV